MKQIMKLKSLALACACLIAAPAAQGMDEWRPPHEFLAQDNQTEALIRTVISERPLSQPLPHGLRHHPGTRPRALDPFIPYLLRAFPPHKTLPEHLDAQTCAETMQESLRAGADTELVITTNSNKIDNGYASRTMQYTPLQLVAALIAKTALCLNDHFPIRLIIKPDAMAIQVSKLCVLLEAGARMGPETDVWCLGSR